MSQPDLLPLINQAAREKWTILDLSGMDLTELPPEIGKLSCLNKLILGKNNGSTRIGNQLSALPAEFAQLINLEELDFRFNKLVFLPPVITQLVNLKGLYLSGNQLQDLPPDTVKLINLEALTLGNNRLKAIPSSVFQLQNLKSLYLDQHGLAKLAPEISQLVKLEELSLRSEQLKELPMSIWSLRNLRKLYLRNNKLTSLPEDVEKLRDLEELDLSKNQFRSLPEAIGQLCNLKMLYIRDNPLKKLPKSTIRIRKALIDIESNFSEFDFSGYDLSDINLTNTNLSDVSLIDANFSRANLSNADLSSNGLSGGKLRNANFSNAILSRVRALGTDFSGAIFTGACIEDWHINAATKFNGVICDYIFLKEGQQERRPSDPSRKFESGEFFTLIQEIRETVDLIFNNGIDWAALLTSIHKLQVESGDNELTIQAIEHKRDGRFVVRVDVPSNADKAEVERFLRGEYESRLKASEEIHLQQLKFKTDQLTFYKEQLSEYRQQNTDLMEMAKHMANRPFQIENKIENKNFQQGEQDSMATINQYGSGDNIGGDKVLGDKIGTQINNSQDLTQAAKDIKALLNQLSMDYPDDSPRVLGAKALDQVAKSPELQSRILRGVRAGSFAALEKMIDHPVAKFFIEGAKEVLKP